MATCVTCGSELHPERAAKYNYCTRRDCRERNAKGLKVLAVGVNKAADQYEVVDGRTRAETAARADDERMPVVGSGKVAARASPPARRRLHRERQAGSWSKPQQELARIRNARGMRPDEIARELGLSTGTVIEMLLAARNDR
jgi:DNA-directed RNA polymerase specialized sigma24 family protein